MKHPIATVAIHSLTKNAIWCKVNDHCHMTRQYRGAACSHCNQCCQLRDFIPRSREDSGLLGFLSGILFGEKMSGKFSGFLENRLKTFFRIYLLVTKHSYKNKSGTFHSHFANQHSKAGFIIRSEIIAKMAAKKQMCEEQ